MVRALYASKLIKVCQQAKERYMHGVLISCLQYERGADASDHGVVPFALAGNLVRRLVAEKYRF